MSSSRNVAIIGFLAAGTIILVLGFWLGGRQGGGTGGIPPLHIRAPADGDSLANPVVVTFTTSAPLHLDPQLGWVARDLHLHAMADTIEIMPGAADITPRGDSTWDWRLPALESGRRRLYLTWAGRHHGNLRGVSDTIRIHIR